MVQYGTVWYSIPQRNCFVPQIEARQDLVGYIPAGFNTRLKRRRSTHIQQHARTRTGESTNIQAEEGGKRNICINDSIKPYLVITTSRHIPFLFYSISLLFSLYLIKPKALNQTLPRLNQRTQRRKRTIGGLIKNHRPLACPTSTSSKRLC